MTYLPTSGQGSVAVTATVTNVNATFGSTTVDTGKTTLATNTFLTGGPNSENVGTTPPAAKN